MEAHDEKLSSLLSQAVYIGIPIDKKSPILEADLNDIIEDYESEWDYPQDES